MPSLFWSGKLTVPMSVLVNVNNLLAVLTGSAGDLDGMTERVRRGYEGEYTDHVRRYDELGYRLQQNAAAIQLEGMSLDDMRVLDVGCGTGALAFAALAHGARAVVCGDIAMLMLRQAALRQTPGTVMLCCQLDAARLPCREGAFDAVLSGMTFGTLPEQEASLAEMVRVTRPGGLVCVGAYGPAHYWEAIDASYRVINKRYILGYRLEWWPRDERYMQRLLCDAGLEQVAVRRVTWREEFADGAAAYDFFAAISASWWYARFPPDAIARDSARTREYFTQHDIRWITEDIVIATGIKGFPSSAE